MSRLALITFLTPDQPGIDNSLPGLPAYPSQGLPGGGQINNGLPSVPGGPVQLPVYPFDPTQLPSPGQPPTPGNELPTPGKKYIVKFLACVGLILVPDNSLPTPPVTPGNELPENPEPK